MSRKLEKHGIMSMILSKDYYITVLIKQTIKRKQKVKNFGASFRSKGLKRILWQREHQVASPSARTYLSEADTDALPPRLCTFVLLSSHFLHIEDSANIITFRK